MWRPTRREGTGDEDMRDATIAEMTTRIVVAAIQSGQLDITDAAKVAEFYREISEQVYLSDDWVREKLDAYASEQNF